MITVKLLGGLGNQMFQAAYAMALKEQGYDVQLDRSSLVEGTHREYSLGYFGIEAISDVTAHPVYELGMRFNPEYLSPKDGNTMAGYWQTEKYFENIADKVRETFTFKGAPIRYVDTIAVHVRRRDYVGLEHFHGMPDLNYYREAVAYIRRRAGMLCPVIVFSDDPKWCFENFPSDFQIAVGSNKYEDLRCMSLCDYQVIANSSFSWWGAWLGPQKLVVAPKQWFSDPNVDYSDIVPNRWMRL
jgi:Glycosyl transferase family 11